MSSLRVVFLLAFALAAGKSVPIAKGGLSSQNVTITAETTADVTEDEYYNESSATRKSVTVDGTTTTETMADVTGDEFDNGSSTTRKSVTEDEKRKVPKAVATTHRTFSGSSLGNQTDARSNEGLDVNIDSEMVDLTSVPATTTVSTATSMPMTEAGSTVGVSPNVRRMPSDATTAPNVAKDTDSSASLAHLALGAAVLVPLSLIL